MHVTFCRVLAIDFCAITLKINEDKTVEYCPREDDEFITRNLFQHRIIAVDLKLSHGSLL